MTTPDELYLEVKPDIEAVANPLFEFSEQCLRKRGNFLPHAAVLDAVGKVGLVAAAPDTKNDQTNSTEVLPLLHDGLRAQAIERVSGYWYRGERHDHSCWATIHTSS